MIHKKLFSHSKRKSKQVFIIVSCLMALIGLIGLALFFTSSRSQSTPLEVMQLDSNAEPIFQVAPSTTYNVDNAPLINKLTTVNLERPLYFTVSISDDFNASAFIDTLKPLVEHASTIYLSLIGTSIEEKEYISLCTKLSDEIAMANMGQIELIWYPMSGEHLKAYNQESIHNLGIQIGDLADFDLLDAIYSRYNAKKTLYVHDVIATRYLEQPAKGSQMVVVTYYTLAMEYPAVQTILCPYIGSPFKEVLTKSPAELILNEASYQTIYTRILSKPWITREAQSLSSTSPYTPLEDYATLSGEEELVLAPTSHLLEPKEDENTVTNYLRYRLNSTPLAGQDYYPYIINLDTTVYPNGINRLKGLPYNASGEMLETAFIDVVIKNDNTVSRAPRLETNYPLGDTPIYTNGYIPILMYHTIADTVAPENENSYVQTDVFDSQLKALVDNGYTTITFKDLWNYLSGVSGLPEKPILITMDDGYLNNYTHAYPIYKKYNLSATLFVSPYYMKEENTERHFGWLAAKEMEESGLIDIESHGYDHTPFTMLSLTDLKYHVSLSKALIEQHLGTRDVFTVACPQFRNNYLTRQTLKNMGVNFQITKLAKENTKMDSTQLKRINVPNIMSPEELLDTLDTLTAK